MTGRATHLLSRLIRAIPIAMLIYVAGFALPPARADSKSESADRVPIAVSADLSQEWDDTEGRILILRGRCRVAQGSTILQSQKMVIWRATQSGVTGKKDRLTIYLEGDVRIEEPGSTFNESPAIVRLGTKFGVEIKVGSSVTGQPARDDVLFLRAEDRRRRSSPRIIRTSQVTASAQPGPLLQLPPEPFPLQPLNTRTRRIRIRARNGNEFNISSHQTPNRTPPEQVTIVTGGVSILIEGIDQTIQGQPVGTIDLSADRMVIWSRSDIVGGGGGVVQPQDEPIEVYLEGNISIFQAADPTNPQMKREAHACAAIFDIRDNKALLLKAELKAYIPSLRGSLRVWGERIQQLGPNAFHAKDAFATTSPYGKPGARVQASDVFLEERYRSSAFGAGPPVVNPSTGALEDETQNWITSLNNVFYVDDVPVFYLPYLSVPADESQMPLQSVVFATDKIFGTQVRTHWDLMKLLGFTSRPGQNWSLLADYLSERGPAAGIRGVYSGSDLFGVVPGKYKGEAIGYYINDQGTDNLGADRRSLIPPDENRGRAEWRHMQFLPDGFTVNAELGYVSDRNFLQEYYQPEFFRGKDIETLVYVKQQQNDWAWTAMVRPNLDPFEYQTQWLPRGDLYALSQPLLNGAVSWSSHTTASYAVLNEAQRPTDPNDVFTPLPYFPSAQGPVLMTRHELDAPFAIGPVHFVPYAMGEASYWGEGTDGSPINRLAIAAGIRSTVEASRIYPTVQSEIFNLNGLAHRVLFEAGYRITEVNRDLSTIPQFNEFDDDAQERFRERLVVNTFGGVLPPPFDPRSYAVRAGAGDWVTAPYYELINDQQVVRLALRQRLQTKVGPLDRQRVRDWMSLDLEASYFPNASRDDFGAPWGLLTARYAWNISPRTTILANALYDTFPQADQLWNVGILSQRTERGSVYLGLRQVKGAQLDSDILTASYSYQMSSKWISTMGTAYDLAEHRNSGQSFTITRVGLDFLIHFGANYDVSTGNVGVALAIEPRIGNLGNGSLTQLSNLLSGQRR